MADLARSTVGAVRRRSPHSTGTVCVKIRQVHSLTHYKSTIVDIPSGILYKQDRLHTSYDYTRATARSVGLPAIIGRPVWARPAMHHFCQPCRVTSPEETLHFSVSQIKIFRGYLSPWEVTRNDCSVLAFLSRNGRKECNRRII